jgi:hypothetical protein
MIHAIETCPTEYSGLGDNGDLYGRQQEDVYFATILNGLHAPIPPAFEASLLFVESNFAEQTLELHLPKSPSEIEESVRRYWGNDTGVSIYERMHRLDTYVKKPVNESDLRNETPSDNIPLLRTIPIGFHKPWLFDLGGPDFKLSNAQARQECKFLKFMCDQC